jgi:GNAT superfamily N-acetyltransferase
VSDWVLRCMRDEDRNYVLSSWLRSYAEGPEFRNVPRSVYFGLYEPLVKQLLARSTIAVATLPDAEDVVLGWMAVEDDALHYVLVKPRWRKLGIARWLLGQISATGAVYTHAPPLREGGTLIPSAWVYDPRRRFGERQAA